MRDATLEELLVSLLATIILPITFGIFCLVMTPDVAGSMTPADFAHREATLTCTHGEDQTIAALVKVEGARADPSDNVTMHDLALSGFFVDMEQIRAFSDACSHATTLGIISLVQAFLVVFMVLGLELLAMKNGDGTVMQVAYIGGFACTAAAGVAELVILIKFVIEYGVLDDCAGADMDALQSIMIWVTINLVVTCCSVGMRFENRRLVGRVAQIEAVSAEGLRDLEALAIALTQENAALRGETSDCPQPQLKLIYFDFPGAAEPIRLA